MRLSVEPTPPPPAEGPAPRRRPSPLARVRASRFGPALTVTQNVTRYLFRGASRSWLRNLGATAPALGSMTLLLLLAAGAGLTGWALQSLASRQAGDAAVLHVYIRDDAAPDAIIALRRQLDTDPRVGAIVYTSKDQALATAQHRPGLGALASDGQSNPFPASFDLKLHRLQDVGAVAASVKTDAAVDPILATSFDPGVYGRIQAALRVLAIGGSAFLLVLGLVTVMVTANSVRSEIHARRDEVAIMQVVGAPRWMVRGPFVVEGALTGAVAGLAAALATVILAAVVFGFGGGHYVQVAPDLTFFTALVAALLTLLAGIVVGSGSSLLGIHRHLES